MSTIIVLTKALLFIFGLQVSKYFSSLLRVFIKFSVLNPRIIYHVLESDFVHDSELQQDLKTARSQLKSYYEKHYASVIWDFFLIHTTLLGNILLIPGMLHKIDFFFRITSLTLQS